MEKNFRKELVDKENKLIEAQKTNSELKVHRLLNCFFNLSTESGYKSYC